MGRLLRLLARRSSAAAPFSPSDIAGLAGWWKADGTLFQLSNGTTAATSDSDPVGYITDYSGNTRPLIEATAAMRPSVKLATRNGLAVIRHDGAGDLVKAVFTLPQPVTIFVAGFLRSLGASGANDSITDGGSVAVMAILSHNAPATLMFAGAAGVGGSFAIHDAWSVSCHVINGASSLGREDGVEYDTGNAGSSTPGGFSLGALADGSRSTALDWGEALVYSSALTTPNILLVEAYLKARWATP